MFFFEIIWNYEFFKVQMNVSFKGFTHGDKNFEFHPKMREIISLMLMVIRTF